MHPVAYGGLTVGGHALGDLALVVRELEVHAPAVDVEGEAEVLGAHHAALQVPAGKAFTPRAGPVHQVALLGAFPQGEVQRAALLVLPFGAACVGLQLLDAPAAQRSVLMFGGILGHIEVHAAVHLVGITLVQDALHHPDLLDQVTGGCGLDAGVEDVEHPHHRMESVGVLLHHLHRLELLQPGPLGDLVLALVHIAHEMPHIGDVTDVADLVAQVLQPAVEHVEGEETAHVAQVHIAVHGGPTDVQPYVRRGGGDELLLAPGERVGQVERQFPQVGHGAAKVCRTPARNVKTR